MLVFNGRNATLCGYFRKQKHGIDKQTSRRTDLYIVIGLKIGILCERCFKCTCRYLNEVK